MSGRCCPWVTAFAARAAKFEGFESRAEPVLAIPFDAGPPDRHIFVVRYNSRHISSYRKDVDVINGSCPAARHSGRGASISSQGFGVRSFCPQCFQLSFIRHTQMTAEDHVNELYSLLGRRLHALLVVTPAGKEVGCEPGTRSTLGLRVIA